MAREGCPFDRISPEMTREFFWSGAPDVRSFVWTHKIPQSCMDCIYSQLQPHTSNAGSFRLVEAADLSDGTENGCGENRYSDVGIRTMGGARRMMIEIAGPENSLGDEDGVDYFAKTEFICQKSLLHQQQPMPTDRPVEYYVRETADED